MDIMKIKNLITNRKRFNYNIFHIIQYIICCVACRKRGNRKKWKKHLLYDRAQDKVYAQLDVVNILRWIEQLKLLTKGLLNHKQKFWLKFQKEHLLEVDLNSDVEKKRKKRERIEDLHSDFIKKLSQNNVLAKKKVDLMLQYLQHGNKTGFDQKIIGGLFEEYASDSEEDDKKNRVMDTEEEKKEFFSLSLPPEPEPRKKQFNKNIHSELTPQNQDIEPLKNLYRNNNNISSIGMSQNNLSRTPKSKSKHELHSKHTFKNKESPFNQLLEKKKLKFKKKGTINYPTNSQNFENTENPSNSNEYDQRHKFADKIIKIHKGGSDNDSNKSHSMLSDNSKEKSGKFCSETYLDKYGDDDQMLDEDQENFIEMAENQINNNISQVNFNFSISYLSHKI